MTEEDAALAERIVRVGEDEIALRLTGRERAILRALFEDLDAAIAPPPVEDEPADADEPGDASADRQPDRPIEPDPDEAVRARLYPSAIPQDEHADAAFRRLVQGDLEADRRDRLATVVDTLDARSIDDRQADAWLHVLNDVRLVMGTRLTVTDETESLPIDADDPDAAAKMVFAYVGWLLGQFVDVLAAALPDAEDLPEPRVPGEPDGFDEPDEPASGDPDR